MQAEILRLQEQLRIMENKSHKETELIIEQTAVVTEQAKQIKKLTEHNNYLEEQLFGSRSERLGKLKQEKAANGDIYLEFGPLFIPYI